MVQQMSLPMSVYPCMHACERVRLTGQMMAASASEVRLAALTFVTSMLGSLAN